MGSVCAQGHAEVFLDLDLVTGAGKAGEATLGRRAPWARTSGQGGTDLPDACPLRPSTPSPRLLQSAEAVNVEFVQETRGE